MEGVVYKSTGSWYRVKDVSSGDFIDCRIKGRFRIDGIQTTNPIAVGDKVSYDLEKGQLNQGVINKIHARHNYIVRKSINLSKRAHIIASNIDQAILFVTLFNPETSTGFIDRFLLTAEVYSIPTVIVFNKIDLLENKESLEYLDYLIGLYESIGYTCIKVSALKSIGVNKVKNILTDKVSLISGHSGTGKSTLINLIDNNLDLKTDIISDSHFKGKHTTTYAEMFDVENIGAIIDTPGIKGLGILDVEKEEISHYFREMSAARQHCKFNNCVHINEPKCNVKHLVEEGTIALSRYDSYISIYNDDENDTYR